MQILDNNYYKEQSAKRIYSTETITASRGNIYDRNGQLLVTNETVYTLKISRSLLPTDRQNEIILNLCKLLTSKGEDYFDTLPFTTEAPFAFTSTEDTAKQIALLEKTLKLNEGALPDEVFAALCKRYKIDAELSDSDKRIIAGVRYEMERSDFSAANPFILASDIAITTVTSIKKNPKYIKALTM
jgi:penicillin-binding protein 2